MTATVTELPLERRSVPRATTLPCPHCLTTRPGPWHYRDAGNLPTDQAETLGYCPTLTARRNGETTR